MEIKLSFIIECGEKTCASSPGKFCKFFGSRRFGTIACCLLFPDKEGLSFTELDTDNDGEWTLRCEDCLSFKK